MGIRSQVILVITSRAYETLKKNISLLKDHPNVSDKLLELIYKTFDETDTYISKDNCYLFEWKSIKWYSNDLDYTAYWIEACLGIRNVAFNYNIKQQKLEDTEITFPDFKELIQEDFRLVEVGFAEEPYLYEHGNFYDNPFNVGINLEITYTE